MARMVLTSKDVDSAIKTLGQPIIEKARANGVSEEKLREAISVPVPKADTYQSRLFKYIPAEVIAVYLTLDGILRTSNVTMPIGILLWLIFALLMLGTPLYLWRVANITRKSQLLISAVSFGIWIFAVGGPFTYLSWYNPLYGALLLPLYTFFVPIVKGSDQIEDANLQRATT
jgi:hypothetical protein